MPDRTREVKGEEKRVSEVAKGAARVKRVEWATDAEALGNVISQPLKRVRRERCKRRA